jgi:hypothetical protein
VWILVPMRSLHGATFPIGHSLHQLSHDANLQELNTSRGAALMFPNIFRQELDVHLPTRGTLQCSCPSRKGKVIPVLLIELSTTPCRCIQIVRGLGIFLFTTASRTALGPTQPPIQCVPGALSPGVKRLGREVDHSPPSSAEVKEYVELYLHSPNTPSWRGA